MAATDKKRTRTPKRRTDSDDSPSEQAGSVGLWFVVGMAVIASVCLLVGALRGGLDWKHHLAAGGCLATGIGFVAIGLLELEWLERIIGFVDGLFSGLVQWFWTSSSGSLSDSELFGRRGATVIWVVIGVPAFVWGCLMALRIVWSRRTFDSRARPMEPNDTGTCYVGARDSPFRRRAYRWEPM